MRALEQGVLDTLRLYLDGKIDQFWFRGDKPDGVVILMNSTSVEEARSIIDALPLAANGYLAFEYGVARFLFVNIRERNQQG